MNVQIVIFNGVRRLSAMLEADLRAGVEDGISALSRHVAVENVGIVVHPSPFVSRETGIGGIAHGPESCAINVDPESEAILHDTRRHMAATVAHELHHVLRMRQNWPQKHEDVCAGDVLVLEGLATRTELFLGFPEPSMVSDIDPGVIATLLDRISPDVAEPRADWSWLYQPSGLPDRVYKALYPMGHHLVGSYLASTGRDPVEAIGVSWQEVWRAARA